MGDGQDPGSGAGQEAEGRTAMRRLSMTSESVGRPARLVSEPLAEVVEAPNDLRHLVDADRLDLATTEEVDALANASDMIGAYAVLGDLRWIEWTAAEVAEWLLGRRACPDAMCEVWLRKSLVNADLGVAYPRAGDDGERRQLGFACVAQGVRP